MVLGVKIYGASNLKEDWISGGAEVSLTTRYVYDGTNSGDTEPFLWNNGREFGMDDIVYVKRSDGNNSTWKWADNKYFMKGWTTSPYYIYKPFAVYNLFEYDPWPAGMHTGTYDGINTGYRSYESFWYMDRVYRNTADTYKKDDGRIMFILQ